MQTIELIAFAITEASKMIVKLSELIVQAEKLEAEACRAEIAKIVNDVQIDEAIERRMFERLQEQARANADPA